MSASVWIAFVVAAAGGATARSVVDGAIAGRRGGLFPWGTVAVNAAGSLLLGLIVGMSLYHDLSDDVAVVAGTGFCGAGTTFSTFGFETVRLLQDGATGVAVRNIVGTVATCAVAAGVGLGLMVI